MIHTEAAAYAEMYFGPGREQAGIVLVTLVKDLVQSCTKGVRKFATRISST